jgi:hypothetical protein
MSASSAHVPSLRATLANHHLEIAAFYAIGAARQVHSRFSGRFHDSGRNGEFPL